MLRPETNHAIFILMFTVVFDHMSMVEFLPKESWMFWIVATPKIAMNTGFVCSFGTTFDDPQHAGRLMIPYSLKLLCDWAYMLAFHVYIKCIFVPIHSPRLELLLWRHWFFYYSHMGEKELNTLPEYVTNRTGITDARFWVTASEVLRKKEDHELFIFHLHLINKVVQAIALACWWIMHRRDRNEEARMRRVAAFRAYNDRNAHQPFRKYFVANDDRLPPLHPAQMGYADPDDHVWNRPLRPPADIGGDNQRPYPPVPSQRMEGG